MTTSKKLSVVHPASLPHLYRCILGMVCGFDF